MTSSVAFITVFPRNQNSFKYRINDGSFHAIRKWDVFDFLSQYISNPKYSLLNDLISRFRPFVIIPEEDTIIELDKSSTPISDVKKLIEAKEAELFRSTELVELNETIANDNRNSEIQDRFLSMKV